MILVTGATGHVGGALLKLLAAHDRPLRCVARRPELLGAAVPAGVEVVRGDLLELDQLGAALDGVDTAYYLVHFLGEGDDFEDKELRAARYFARAAKRAGVRRIVYLGGLGDEKEALSAHLHSRHAVGRLLWESGASCIELRTSIIIGGGSFSFRLLQKVARLMPVVISHDWVRARCQPIALEDVLAYLLAAAGLETGESEMYEIGGPEQLSYGELLQRYAAEAGLKPVVLPSPISLPLPSLSKNWLHNLAPSDASIALRLIESMKHDTIVRDGRARGAFHLQPMPLREAIQRALAEQHSAAGGPA